MAGLALGGVFIFLAFHRVDFRQMGAAFHEARYVFLFPALALLMLSIVLRSLRWGQLLEPVRRVGRRQLFSALMIGYMGNSFLPAHLGELLRAYIIGRNEKIPAGAVFASIVVERIIDVFTLLLFMAFTLVVFPFPPEVRLSGYITFAFVVALFVLLVVMKRHRPRTLQVAERLLRFLPPGPAGKLLHLLHSFLDGIVPLKYRRRYAQSTALSLAIWLCYAASFQAGFYAFSFQARYRLPWSAALVLLVITTFSIIIPSSPGYVGTYHYLCQLSLGLFAIPKGPALSFAFVMHALNFFPFLVIGGVLLWRNKISLQAVRQGEQAGGWNASSVE